MRVDNNSSNPVPLKAAPPVLTVQAYRYTLPHESEVPTLEG